MPLKNIDILFRRIEDEARVVFVQPYSKEFHRACQALEIRGLLKFGKNPIKVDGVDYNHYYADLKLDAEAYGNYAMLVRDFYDAETRGIFNNLFHPLDVDKIPRTVHNPNTYMRGNQKLVARLIEKYKTIAPLEFYGSPFPAEVIALLLKSLKDKKSKGAINNCEQGMAKTRQSIVAWIESEYPRVLVIAPKSARVTTWPTELKKIGSGNYTHSLIDKDNWLGGANFDILQWDSLRLMPEEFFQQVSKYPLVICDEYQLASNVGSQRSIALEKITEAIPKLWALTGTAVRKRPRNVLNLLRLLKHPLVDTEEKIENFLFRYCGYYNPDFNNGPKRPPGKFIDAPQNLEELHELLRDCLIRYEKSQCNLPPKLLHIVELELSKTERIEYDGAWQDFKSAPDRAKKMLRPGYPFGTVKQKIQHMAASRIKTPHVIEWAETLIDAGEKVVIFTDVTDIWETLMRHFGELAVGIHGGSSNKVRADAVERFQTDPSVMVFVGNIVAAGVSLTLTAARYLAFTDINRVPTDVLQAMDRINRGGATDVSMIYFFLALETADVPVFADFVKSKDVVEQITARRDANGNIRDTPWVGPIEKYKNWGKM